MESVFQNFLPRIPKKRAPAKASQAQQIAKAFDQLWVGKEQRRMKWGAGLVARVFCALTRCLFGSQSASTLGTLRKHRMGSLETRVPIRNGTCMETVVRMDNNNNNL